MKFSRWQWTIEVLLSSLPRLFIKIDNWIIVIFPPLSIYKNSKDNGEICKSPNFGKPKPPLGQVM